MVTVSYDHRLCDVTSPYVYIYNDSRREFGFSPDQSVFNFCSTATRWGGERARAWASARRGKWGQLTLWKNG